MAVYQIIEFHELEKASKIAVEILRNSVTAVSSKGKVNNKPAIIWTTQFGELLAIESDYDLEGYVLESTPKLSIKLKR